MEEHPGRQIAFIKGEAATRPRKLGLPLTPIRAISDRRSPSPIVPSCEKDSREKIVRVSITDLLPGPGDKK